MEIQFGDPVGGRHVVIELLEVLPRDREGSDSDREMHGRPRSGPTTGGRRPVGRGRVGEHIGIIQHQWALIGVVIQAAGVIAVHVLGLRGTARIQGVLGPARVDVHPAGDRRVPPGVP